jgi:hypothetical protein
MVSSTSEESSLKKTKNFEFSESNLECFHEILNEKDIFKYNQNFKHIIKYIFCI